MDEKERAKRVGQQLEGYKPPKGKLKGYKLHAPELAGVSVRDPARLSEEQGLTVIAEIMKRAGGSITCSACGTEEWTLLDLLARLMVAGTGTGRAYPTVVLMCRNCGQMLLFNGLALGLDVEPLRGGDGGDDG